MHVHAGNKCTLQMKLFTAGFDKVSMVCEKQCLLDSQRFPNADGK